MRNQSLLAAMLALPLLLVACDRSEQSPTATVPGEEKQAITPSTPDQMLERSAPAAGTPASPDAATPAMPPSMPPAEPAATAPDAPPADESKKAY